MQALKSKEIRPEKFPHQIAFNLFPHIEDFHENDYTNEEIKIVNESRKILNLPELQVNCTCVRLPIFRVHCESLLLEFEEDITPNEAREILDSSPGIKILDDVSKNVILCPSTLATKPIYSWEESDKIYPETTKKDYLFLSREIKY